MMTFARFQLAYFALRWGLLNPRPVPAWSDHPELGSIHEQMRALIARHVIAGCPLLWIFLSAAIPAAFTPSLFDANSSKHVRLVPGLKALDELLIRADSALKAMT